jgi:hypothetical protein
VAHFNTRLTYPSTGNPHDAAQRRLLPNPALKGMIDLIMASVTARVNAEA